MISKDKEYQTRDGREVRIYATDGGGDYPVHGAYFNGAQWISGMWSKKGEYFLDGNTPMDLIEKPKIIKGWVNVYSETYISDIYSTRELADIDSLGRIACIPVEFKEGEGL
jgi:hypothetical protein